MGLKPGVWDGIGKSRENVMAFFEGLLDFLSGGKGSRRRGVVPKDVSLASKDSYEAHIQSLRRFFSRIQEHDLRDAVVLNLLNTTYEFYESWKPQILALRLQKSIVQSGRKSLSTTKEGNSCGSADKQRKSTKTL